MQNFVLLGFFQIYFDAIFKNKNNQKMCKHSIQEIPYQKLYEVFIK